MNRFMDSCQHYSDAYITAKWTDRLFGAIDATGSPRSTPVLFGGFWSKTIEDLQDWIVGFRVKWTGSLEVVNLIQFIDGLEVVDSPIQCGVILLIDGRLQVAQYSGNSIVGVQGSPSTTALLEGVWYYVEVKAHIEDTPNGSVEVRINNIVEITATGIDTQRTGNDSASMFRLNNGSGLVFYYCDIYMNDINGGIDDDFWDDVEIDYLKPDGAGAFADYTPVGDPDNWKNVNEQTPDLNDYNEDNTPGDRDSYTMEDTSTTSVIRGIQIVALCAKTDGSDREVKLVSRIAGVNYDGDTQEVPASPAYLLQQYGVSPAPPNNDWTAAEFNAAEQGIKTET